MHNRSPKTLALSLILAGCLGVGLFALAAAKRVERQAESDTLTFDVGAERQRATKLIAEQRRISEREAARYLKALEERKQMRVLNKLSLPNGTFADYVKVSGGKHPVKKNGAGILLRPDSELGRRYYESVVGQEGTAAHRYFQEQWEKARRQGFFNWSLSSEQRDRLLSLAAEQKSGTTRSRQATVPTPVALKTLVVAVEFPEWVDRAPQYSTTNPRLYYSTTGQLPETVYFHPISDQDTDGVPDRFQLGLPIGETPGGALNPTFATNNSSFALVPPTWADQTHPGVRGSTYPQSVDMRENLYTLLLDPANPNSVVNYYWQNSHGHVRLSGDRSDIVGWLESRHPLDRTDIAPATAPVYAFQPGTPLIRPIAEPTGQPFIAYASINTTADRPANPTAGDEMVDSWITIVWSRSVYDIPGATTRLFYTIESPAGFPMFGLGNSSVLRLQVDPFDSRRVVILVDEDGTTSGRYWSFFWQITFDNTLFGGGIRQSVTGLLDNGPNLPNTDYVTSDVLQTTGPSDFANPQAPLTPHRLKSYCYYTCNHLFQPNDPYQLRRLRNRKDNIDDIGGNVEQGRDRASRPAPYDHDLEDHSRPTGGIVGAVYPHDVTAFKEDVNLLLTDNGIDVTQYDRVIYVYPDGGNPAFIANGDDTDDTIMIPESAQLPTAASRLGVTFGFPNLFDTDVAMGYVPPHRVTHAMGPYSLMASGIRLDPYCKLIASPGPWIDPIVVTADRLGQRIPAIETQGPSDESRVLFIPVPGQTGEYFLVENHDQQLYGDTTPRGLTIFHVDPRYGLFYPPDLPPNSGGQNDDLWLVAVEQADGQFELERRLATQALTTLDTDSFGADAGSGITVWDQYATDLAGAPRTTSASRGLADSDGNLQPGTAFDSYIRLGNISATGPVMTADVYVEPRELVVTGTPLAPTTIQQGATNVAMLALDFTHSTSSTNDVTVSSIRLNESGSSKVDTDVKRVALFDDSNGLAGFQPTATGSTVADRLVAATTFLNQEATFTDLAYLVSRGATRRLFVVYDLADDMDTSAEATVGVSIAQADHIRAQVPGAIQERTPSGTFRFPIPQGTPAKSKVVEAGDTLLVTPQSRAPATVNQGTQNVPMLLLNLSANRDTVLVKRLRLRENGTSDQDTDLLKVHLYDDPEQDGVIGLNDVLLASAPLSNQVADFQGLSILVTSSAPRSILVTYDVSDFAQLGKTLSAALPDISYVTLSDAADTVSEANFPVESSPMLIGRAAHVLYVSASSLALPFVDPGQTDVPFEKLVLTPDAGVITLNGMTLRQSGTATLGANNDVKAIKVYRDTNQSGLLETTGSTPDQLLVQSTTFVDTDLPGDGVADGVRFTTAEGTFPANFTVSAGSSETLFLAVDVGDAGTAVVGRTVQLTLLTDTSLDASPDATLLSSGTFPVLSGESTLRGLVDATVGETVVADTPVLQGTRDVSMVRYDFSGVNNDVIVDKLTIGRGGNGTDADVAQVKVYLDTDGDQVLNTAVDRALGAAPFTNGQFVLSSLNLTIRANEVVSVFVLYDVSGSALVGSKLAVELVSSGALSGAGVQVKPTVVFPLTSNDIVVADAPPKVASCEASESQALVQFSEPVQQAEAEDVTSLQIESPPGTVIHSAATPMAGLQIKYDRTIKSMVVSGVSFVLGDRVRFTVANVRDLAGNVILPPDDNCTATVGQAVSPQIVACSLEETGVLRVSYSKDVNPAGAGGRTNDLDNFALTVDGSAVSLAAAGISYDSSTRSTVITGLTVTRGQPYALLVSGVTDIFGNALIEDGKDNACSGTVADAVAPSLVSVTSYSDAIQVKYSEPMEPATTAVAARYTVTQGGAQVTLSSVSLSSDRTVATLIPATKLTLGGTLTVVIRDVTDLAGRALSPNPTTHTSNVGFSLTFPGHGLTLFSVPLALTPPADDPAAVFGAGFKVARFDPVLSQYEVYPTTTFGFEVGRGYWARFNQDTPLVLSNGQLTSTLTPFAYPMANNQWSLFGNPYLNTLSWNVDNLTVRVNGVTTPLRQLVGSPSPVVEIYAWAYDALARDYYLISDPRVIPGVRSTLPAGGAAWVRSNVANAVLNIPAPVSVSPPPATPSTTRAASADAAHWAVELIATSGDARDAGNLLGVASGRALSIQNPPPAPDQSGYVELSFVNTSRSGEPTRGEIDLRSSASPRQAWELELRTDRAGHEVRVQWPDLSSLPRQYRLRFVDTLTGQAVAMRTTKFYSFQANRVGVTSRRFRVEQLPAEESALRISSVSVAPAGRAGAAGLTVSYTLSREADVQIRVLSAAGRQVGVMRRDAVRSGVNLASWSARSAGYQTLPRGLYLVELSARDDEGRAVRAVQQVLLR